MARAAKKEFTVASIAKAAGVSTRMVYRLYKANPDSKTWDAERQVEFLKAPVAEKKLLDEETGIKVKSKGGYKPCLPEQFQSGTGMRCALRFLEHAEQATRSEWARLVGIGHKDAGRAFQQWTSVHEQWLKVAANTPKALKALDDSISREQHTMILSAAFQAADRALKKLAQKIANDGENLPRAALFEVCLVEVDTVRDALMSGVALDEVLAEMESDETDLDA